MKKITKGFVLAAFIALISNFAYAQEYIMGIGDYIDYANIDRTMIRNDNTYANIEGSPFLFSDFKTGKIKLKDGKIYEGPLRYDIYADQIEFKTSEGEIFAVENPETVDKVFFDDIQLKYFSALSGNSSLHGLFELLVDGNYILFEKHRVELKDPVPAKPYVEPKPATFNKKKSVYLVMNPEGFFTEIENKKGLALLDPTKKNEIEKFVKKNKLKVSDKEDMIMLVNFLNEE